MYRRLGTDFVFVSTSVMREERKKLGYAQDEVPEYVLLSYAGDEQKKKAISLINEADVVISGSAPNELLLGRLRSGKLILRYSERPFKKTPSLLRKIYHTLSFRRNDLWKKKNIYMLCAGAYSAGDYKSIGMYKGRAFKWGYFPDVKEYDIASLLSEKSPGTIMWCGRFIDWKHPEAAVAVARRLKEKGYDFCLNMVGTGAMEDELKGLVADYGLEDVVHFLGAMSPEQVRAHMETAEIYLFTSDRREGWGAVLNESMNSGCAVVASHAIGAVPYLLKNGENGIIYEAGNTDMLCEKVEYLLENPEMRENFGRMAYYTVLDIWNAEVAAERLLALTEKLLSGERDPRLFDEGPCSRAEAVSDGYRRII